eukprot:13940780-Alexandrium_andersonii.AAC.1
MVAERGSALPWVGPGAPQLLSCWTRGGRGRGAQRLGGRTSASAEKEQRLQRAGRRSARSKAQAVQRFA